MLARVGDRLLGNAQQFRLGRRGSHKAWKHRAQTGGGAANEMLVHMLDLALWYFGEPESATRLAGDILLGAAVALALDGRMATHLLGRWQDGRSSLREPLDQVAESA